MPQRSIVICRLVVVMGAVLVSGCAAWPRPWGARPCCISSKPVVRHESVGWHLFDVTVIAQVKRAFNIVRIGRSLFGLPVRSLNLHNGDITDSAFFSNRPIADIPPAQVRWGPTRPDDLAVPPYTITKSKMEGKTAGFFVTDSRGVRYLFKLDPPQAPELLSGAEAVTSKLLYLLGYHVPSYEVALTRPQEFHVSPDAVTKTPQGQLRPLTEKEVTRLIAAHERTEVLRVSASKILDGDILGPAPFKRFRDCAEIRALKLAYAWVNDIDSKDHNSLLVWDGQQTVGYLIDFGTSLGADAGLGGPKTPCEGWLNAVDLRESALKMITLGLHHPVCDPDDNEESRSIGLFTPHVDPERWKPYVPNLAFEEMNEEDARWMARRLAAISRAQIDAAVAAGQYSHPQDATYLAEMLDQRRQAIVRRYLKE